VCLCSVRLSVGLCLSITSRCPTETINVGSRKQRHTIAEGLYSYLMPKISAKLRRGHPQRRRANAGGYRLNAGEVAESWRRSTRSAVNLALSHVYHSERPPYLFAAYFP